MIPDDMYDVADRNNDVMAKITLLLQAESLTKPAAMAILLGLYVKIALGVGLPTDAFIGSLDITKELYARIKQIESE